MEMSKLGFCPAGMETLSIERPDVQSAEMLRVLSRKEVDYLVKAGFKLINNQWHDYSELVKPLPAPFTYISIRLSDDGQDFVCCIMQTIEEINTYRGRASNVTDVYSVQGHNLIWAAKEGIRAAIELLNDYHVSVIRALEACLEENDGEESEKKA